jgi:Fur family zinc uptake transcriptional regulator
MSAFDNASASFAGARHDHRSCVTQAMATAARLCTERGARLTPLRRRVLELIWRGHAPAKHAPVRAYDLLARLSDKGARAAPPTVYRALEFLLAHGLIHRIESLNAYVGCMHPEGAHGGQFLICEDCGAAAEVHDPRAVGCHCGDLVARADSQRVKREKEGGRAGGRRDALGRADALREPSLELRHGRPLCDPTGP